MIPFKSMLVKVPASWHNTIRFCFLLMPCSVNSRNYPSYWCPVLGYKVSLDGVAYLKGFHSPVTTPHLLFECHSVVSVY